MQNKIEQLDRLSETSGGMHKQRLINIMNKQIEQKTAEINEKKESVSKVDCALDELKVKLDDVSSRTFNLIS